jgi:biopolymer transport protein ExbD
MGLSTGGGGGSLQNEINVTPMIDVLLVLLVIFMMAVPATRKAIDVQIPDPTPQQVSNPQAAPDQIVLQVLPNGAYKINNEDVSKDMLSARIKEIYEGRPTKIIFIKGDPKVMYQDVIHAMDVSRGSGVRVIGLTPQEK